MVKISPKSRGWFPIFLWGGRVESLAKDLEACKDALAAMKEADGKAKAASKALKALPAWHTRTEREARPVDFGWVKGSCIAPFL